MNKKALSIRGGGEKAIDYQERKIPWDKEISSNYGCLSRAINAINKTNGQGSIEIQGDITDDDIKYFDKRYIKLDSNAEHFIVHINKETLSYDGRQSFKEIFGDIPQLHIICDGTDYTLQEMNLEYDFYSKPSDYNHDEY